MNYKLIKNSQYIGLLIALYSLSATVYALPGLSVTKPDQTHVAAKYAKHKSKIQAERQSISEDDIAKNTSGCDLNIGNVAIDQGIKKIPSELIVIIEGDVIQANECNSH